MRTFFPAAALAFLLSAADSTAAPAPRAAPIVHVRDDAFVPATTVLRAGDTVTFVNDDDDAHTATADNASWDSEGLPQGGRWTHRFAKAGTTKYHCTVHPMMHGTIVVRSAS